MLPSYLRHMRYESRSRRQQRPVSLYRRNACEVGLEFNFVDMPAVKTCDVSWGFLVAGGLMSSCVGVISQAVVAFSPFFSVCGK